MPASSFISTVSSALAEADDTDSFEVDYGASVDAESASGDNINSSLVHSTLGALVSIDFGPYSADQEFSDSLLFTWTDWADQLPSGTSDVGHFYCLSSSADGATGDGDPATTPITIDGTAPAPPSSSPAALSIGAFVGV